MLEIPKLSFLIFKINLMGGDEYFFLKMFKIQTESLYKIVSFLYKLNNLNTFYSMRVQNLCYSMIFFALIASLFKIFYKNILLNKIHWTKIFERIMII